MTGASSSSGIASKIWVNFARRASASLAVAFLPASVNLSSIARPSWELFSRPTHPRFSSTLTSRLTVLFSKRSLWARSFCKSGSSRVSSNKACASATATGSPQGVSSSLCNPNARIKEIMRSCNSRSVTIGTRTPNLTPPPQNSSTIQLDS
jgi:hypothetical protein